MSASECERVCVCVNGNEFERRMLERAIKHKSECVCVYIGACVPLLVRVSLFKRVCLV